MQFNPVALDAKHHHLDAIHHDPARLARVLRALLSDVPYELTPLARPWEPGGGASLFRVTTATATYFLKVKHLAVTIESKLESEPEFSSEPSLRNEQRQLQRFAGAPFVPVVYGYAEDGDHAFLLLEWLAPFEAVAPDARCRRPRRRLRTPSPRRYARSTSAASCTPTCTRRTSCSAAPHRCSSISKRRARSRKRCRSQRSLDVVGRTGQGDVGTMPDAPGRLPGLTCLERLHAVFAALVQPKLEELIQSVQLRLVVPLPRDPRSRPRRARLSDHPGARPHDRGPTTRRRSARADDRRRRRAFVRPAVHAPRHRRQPRDVQHHDGPAPGGAALDRGRGLRQVRRARESARLPREGRERRVPLRRRRRGLARGAPRRSADRPGHDLLGLPSHPEQGALPRRLGGPQARLRDARDGEPTGVLRRPLVGVRGRAHQPRPRDAVRRGARTERRLRAPDRRAVAPAVAGAAARGAAGASRRISGRRVPAAGRRRARTAGIACDRRGGATVAAP